MRLSLAVSAAAAAALALAACAHADEDAFHIPDTQVLIEQAAYPEGPVWILDDLDVAEMRADRVSRFRDGRGERHTVWEDRGCGPTAIAPYDDGLLIMCHVRAEIVALGPDGAVRFRRNADSQGHAFRNPNDASADVEGGVYFSDPGPFYRDMRPSGAIVYIDAEGVARRVADDLWYPNGVLVDWRAQRLYVSETFRHRVLRYAIADDHSLTLIDTLEVDAIAPPQRAGMRGYADWGPDGLEFAPNGDLFIALYGRGQVIAVTKEFQYVGVLEPPPQYITNVAFGREGELYTTGAFDNLTLPNPGELRRWDSFTLAPGRGGP